MKKFSILFSIFVLLTGCSQPKLYSETQVMMGTFVEVKSPESIAAKIAFDEIRRIENLLSKYKADSEISRLNASGSLMVSAETFYVVKRAKEFWADSEGAFDITVGPLMEIWGFTTKNYRVPSGQEIKKSLELVGSDKIILKTDENLIELKVPGMKIDLGAIAKGYAVDCAVIKLRQAGVKDCLVRAGGSVYCLGKKFGKPWKVGIQDPRGPKILETLNLSDKAVDTSGGYEQFFNFAGKKFSHIMNPLLGKPADSGVASVTIIAADCLTADALATSVFILGKEGAAQLLEKHPGVEVRIIKERYDN